MSAPSDLDLVFPTRSGGIENASNFLNRGLAPALRRAGIRRIDVHSLRHAYASLMIEAGVNLQRLQILMGHSSFRVTMDTYAHLIPDVRDDAVMCVTQLAWSTNGDAAKNLDWFMPRIQGSLGTREDCESQGRS